MSEGAILKGYKRHRLHREKQEVFRWALHTLLSL
jgi:hypothetical protein